MQGRVAREFDLSWIDHEEFGTAQNSLFDPCTDDRVSLRRVAPCDEEAGGPLDVIKRICGRTRAEGSLHRGCGRGVAHSGAAIDIVRAEDDSGKLLHDIILLICAAGGANHADAL